MKQQLFNIYIRMIVVPTGRLQNQTLVLLQQQGKKKCIRNKSSTERPMEISVTLKVLRRGFNNAVDVAANKTRY